MLYPSIDKLLTMVDSKYTLVIAASKRARRLNEGEEPLLLSTKNKKNVGIGLEEIYEKKLHCYHETKANN
ncbi:DNA-directed RNA polymerase subunit omega [Desulfuribacillus alkaliarsenatis]|uniref:DNA-directed RNA polymerase subunit omega n=1 Tax=Desulfuribacillus alkaliarsenatis TaxID=766136 RepID=A0A1E5G5S3_9FIRM|nr:DNA-directed RNA polymerase subunit omega [Desulfuribacillus alkaliarsenatis]OEF98530.1 DNA-directed RNA polymerase subunit omega [Desulfuribacillus alkaliarsenatis]